MRTLYGISGIMVAFGLAALLTGCGGHTAADMPPATTATFEVTLLNLTAGQPLSPLVAVAHNEGFSLFTVGEPASIELEHLAEGGESAPLKALAADSKSVFASAVGVGLPPGPNSHSTVTLTVPLSSLPTLRLSLAAMLGNTNDGFTGLSNQSLATLSVGATRNTNLLSYDAGTELHTETADNVPGPATTNSGGKREGFNATRDDVINSVHLHPGIVSKDDGLPTSALTQANRWDNSVALLSIKRTN